MSAATMPARNGRPHGAPIFLLAIVLGIGAHVAVLTLFNFTVLKPQTSEVPAPGVRYIQSADQSQAEVMRDEARFSDPRILYSITPTENAVGPTPPAVAGVKPMYSPYPLDLAANFDGGMKILSPQAGPPATPTEALNTTALDVLHTMGGTANTGSVLARRGAQLRIARLPDGGAGAAAGAATEVTWPEDMAPDSGTAIWSSVSFQVMVDATGTAGPLQMKSSSGIGKVDTDLGAKLKNWLQQNHQKPGWYLIEIGP